MRFEPQTVVIGLLVRPVGVSKNTKKENTKVTENALPTQTPFLSSHINQILHVGSYPGYLSWFCVSLKSVEKCGSCGGRNFGLPIDLAHRLYNSLLLLHKLWCEEERWKKEKAEGEGKRSYTVRIFDYFRLWRLPILVFLLLFVFELRARAGRTKNGRTCDLLGRPRYSFSDATIILHIYSIRFLLLIGPVFLFNRPTHVHDNNATDGILLWA